MGEQRFELRRLKVATAAAWERSGALMLAVTAVLLVASLNFVLEYRSAVDRVRAAYDAEIAKPVDDRRIAVAFSYDVSRAFMLKARELIRPRGTYAFVTGPNASASLPTTVPAAPFVGRYLLLPRREVPLDRADWLLCYGCSLSALSVRTTPVWREPGTGLVIARIAR